MKIQIIFDKDRVDERLCAGWGVAYLVNGSLLFDTGEKGDYLIRNMHALGVEVDAIKSVVVSHNHWDHWGGLQGLLDANSAPKVYACTDVIENLKKRGTVCTKVEVTDFCEIENDIYTSGCVRTPYDKGIIFEQSIALKTPQGISLLCGCAHPGIVEVVKQAKSRFPGEPIHALLGGFHLMNTEPRIIRNVIEELKKHGVALIGPSHCTGFEAQQLLKEAFGDNFLAVKAGAVFDL